MDRLSADMHPGSVGLILGGVLTDFVGWRWIFWISLMISAIVVPSACLVLPPTDTKREAPVTLTNTEESNTEESRTAEVSGLQKLSRSVLSRLIRFDVLGIGLGLSGIILLNYAFSTANSLGWGSGQILGTLIPAVVLLVLFGFQESYATVSLLPSHLFRSLSFNLTLALAAISFAIRQGCTYFLTLQLQSYGASPVHTSVLFLPLGVTALLFFPVSGRILGKIGARNMVRTTVSFYILTISLSLLLNRFPVHFGPLASPSRRAAFLLHHIFHLLFCLHFSGNDTLSSGHWLRLFHIELRYRIRRLQVRPRCCRCRVQCRSASRRLSPWLGDIDCRRARGYRKIRRRH